MNQTAIYSKTGKGVQEATGRTSILSRADRAVLASIDGKTTVGELNIKFDKIPEANFFALIERLERDGFVREASPGIATRPPPARRAAPPAAPPSAPPPGGASADLDFTQILPAPQPAKPSLDLAAKARAEAERKAQEDSLGYKAREAAEAKAKAEAQERARAAAAAKAKAEAEERAKAAESEAHAKAAESEARARKQAEKRPEEPAGPAVDLEKQKEEIERVAREAMERARKEAEEKASREAEALRLKMEQARRALEEAEARRREEEARQRREEEERKRKQEEERRARDEAERKRKEEEERKRKDAEERKRKEEEARRAREEAERKRKEEEERKRKEAEERKRKEEEARRAREEAERKRKEEEARRAREEAERKRKEEEERKRREEEERKRKEEEARKRREEEERKRREEEERKRKEEEARKRKEEERKRREEAERREREEAVRKAREEADRRRDEEDRKRREEAERKRKEEEQRERARLEDEERSRQKERERMAAGGESFADSLLADLESFSQRDDEQRHALEAAAQEEKERMARETEARRRHDEEEREQERARDSALISSVPPGGAEPSPRAKRRLAAIVAADVVGYSRMMGQDEEGTLERLRAVLNDIVKPMVAEHGGHIVKTVGDGLLIEFASVVSAVRWAAETQEAVVEGQMATARDRQIIFRMGINLGDIISDENDVFGDGVNVAARLEGLADHGGICISSTVYDQVRDKVSYKFQDLGKQRFKNISRPVHVYRLRDERAEARARAPVLQDAASLEPATAKLKPVELDDIEVSEEDLRMDEVKRDEKVLTKEARKEARELAKQEKRRLKEEKRRLKAEQEPIKPIKVRRPRKWGRTAFVTVLLVVVGTVAAVHLAPVPVTEYARAASAALGQPVSIGSARMSLLRGLEIVFRHVKVGDGVMIDKVHAFPDIGTLTGDKKTFRRIEIDGATVRQDSLGALLFGSMKPGALRVERVEVSNLRFPGAAVLPTFSADARIAGDGTLKSVTLKGPDNLVANLTPRDGVLGVDVNADHFTVPFAPEMALSAFTAKGSATREGMSLTAWSGAMLDGELSGTARIQWGPVWTVEGALKVHRINGAVFAPALLSEGRIEEGRGAFRMSGANPAKLYENARMEAHLEMSKGALGSFDLSRVIQTAGGQSSGRTVFAEMSADAVYDRGAVALRNVNLSAGALSAAATVEVAPNGALNMRIVADMRTQSQLLRQTLNVGGTVKEPAVKENRR